MTPEQQRALTQHLDLVIPEIESGQVVPFLGAGVNLCGRPPGTSWQLNREWLPSGAELAEYLANKYRFPDGEPRDLARVTQYVSVMQGSGPLYRDVRDVFDDDYAPTAVHRCLASIPGRLRARIGTPKEAHRLLVVTTNYDDALERAFLDAGEPLDVVWYVADGDERGRFRHRTAGGDDLPIERPDEYREEGLETHSVVLKIHGAIDRSNPDRDSFVITEDHYIDYLTHTDVSNLVPVTLAAKLRRSHFLFLGYGLQDWNLRVILHRIWREQRLSYRSWALQRSDRPVEEKLWAARGVDVHSGTLEDYIVALESGLAAGPATQGP